MSLSNVSSLSQPMIVVMVAHLKPTEISNVTRPSETLKRPPTTISMNMLFEIEDIHRNPFTLKNIGR
jgi:hypothetical protein